MCRRYYEKGDGRADKDVKAHIDLAQLKSVEVNGDKFCVICGGSDATQITVGTTRQSST